MPLPPRGRAIASNDLLEIVCYSLPVAATWSFLTNHARVLVCIAHDPGLRLRDIAAQLGITERSAFGIVCDLVEAGYVTRTRDGRRNRYEIRSSLPLRETIGRERTIGEVLEILVGSDDAEPASGAAST
jgi:DNA-binding transcriptional ArsR family regulator